ncbi:MAG TPA: hypothetical protein VMR74_05685 [Gammaproteobacteria bacterium]|nr:hypothetical protein [Gammaproteobacteria bacterium]
MDDEQIPWTRAGACLEVLHGRDGLTVVADPDGTARETFEITSLEACGPAVVSPAPSDSLGLWLESWLRDESAIASWRIVACDGSSFDVSTAGGNCRLVCRGLVARGPASRFRHDAHSLLNAIGMNADLVGMLAGPAGIERVESAASRIRTSSDALAALISSRTEELESGSRVPVAAALGDALSRAGIEGIDVKDEVAAEASSLWCFATSRVLIEWVAWLGRAERVRKRVLSRGLELTCDRHAVSLYGEGPRPSAAGPRFPILPPANAAAPELEPAEPTVVLGGIGVGFGSWQTRGASGVCVGIPAS